MLWASSRVLFFLLVRRNPEKVCPAARWRENGSGRVTAAGRWCMIFILGQRLSGAILFANFFSARGNGRESSERESFAYKLKSDWLYETAKCSFFFSFSCCWHLGWHSLKAFWGKWLGKMCGKMFVCALKFVHWYSNETNLRTAWVEMKRFLKKKSIKNNKLRNFINFTKDLPFSTCVRVLRFPRPSWSNFSDKLLINNPSNEASTLTRTPNHSPAKVPGNLSHDTSSSSSPCGVSSS